MRPIATAVCQAQAVAAPNYGVTVTLMPTGHGAERWLMAWRTWQGGVATPRLCAVTDNGMGMAALIFLADAGGVAIQLVDDVASAANWLAPAHVGTILPDAPIHCMDAWFALDSVRLFFGNDAGLHYIESPDHGVTWGAPVTAPIACKPARDLYVTTGVGSTWYIGFTDQDGSVRLVANAGAEWRSCTWGVGWRFGGFLGPSFVAGVRMAMLRQTPTAGDRIVEVGWTAPSQWTVYGRLDGAPGGRTGVQLPWCYMHPAFPNWGLVGERGAAGELVVGVAALWNNMAHGRFMMEEAQPLVGLSGLYASENRLRLYVSEEGMPWVVGDGLLVQGDPLYAQFEVVAPARYVYSDGVIELELPTNAPDIQPGVQLSVQRTVSDGGGASGAQEFRVMAVAVERRRDGVHVVAYDPVGYLAWRRVRRACVLAPDEPGCNTVGQLLRRLCARVGLETSVDYAHAQEALYTDHLTAQPGESWQSVANRLDRRAWLPLAPDGDNWRVILAPVGLDPTTDPAFASLSGRWPAQPTAGWKVGAGYEPAASSVRASSVRWLSDARRPALAVVHGQAGPGPDDGALIVVRGAPSAGRTHAPVEHATDRLRTGTEVIAAATAAAYRQSLAQVECIVETNANLGLELYDWVTVWEPVLGIVQQPYRVVRSEETWEQGKLTQRLHLVAGARFA